MSGDSVWCNILEVVKIECESVIYAAVEVLIRHERLSSEAAMSGVV